MKNVSKCIYVLLTIILLSACNQQVFQYHSISPGYYKNWKCHQELFLECHSLQKFIKRGHISSDIEKDGSELIIFVSNQLFNSSPTKDSILHTIMGCSNWYSIMTEIHNVEDIDFQKRNKWKVYLYEEKDFAIRRESLTLRSKEILEKQ